MTPTNHSGEKEVQSCLVCGTRTDAWVRGWDGQIRCTRHAADGPRPWSHPLSEYQIEGDQGHMEVIHSLCGQRLMLGLTARLDELFSLAWQHTCAPVIPPGTSEETL